MEDIIICTTFYEKGIRYLADYFKSIHEAKLNIKKKIRLNIAIDNLKKPNDIINYYRENLDISIISNLNTNSISNIRNILIKNTLNLEAQFVIFMDMDDIFTKKGIYEHLNALKNDDISFGDMRIIDKDNNYLNRNFFDNNIVPETLKDHKPLLNKNFMGLSNTAIHMSSLKKYFSEVPHHLKATDWWMFTMLLYKGCSAKKTESAVVCYRQHRNNILGNRKYSNLEDFLSYCNIARQHFQSLPKKRDFISSLQKVNSVIKRIKTNPKDILQILNDEDDFNKVWFSEIFKICKHIDK